MERPLGSKRYWDERVKYWKHRKGDAKRNRDHIVNSEQGDKGFFKRAAQLAEIEKEIELARWNIRHANSMAQKFEGPLKSDIMKE